jgi:hypothetical protein
MAFLSSTFEENWTTIGIPTPTVSLSSGASVDVRAVIAPVLNFFVTDVTLPSVFLA